MNKFIPTMDVAGWVNDLSTAASKIISAFLTTNTSMSVLHLKQNTSMQHILKVTAQKTYELENQLQEELLRKLQTTFGENAQARVEVNMIPDKPDQYNILFTGTVYDANGRPYTVGKLVYFKDSVVVKIAEINNGARV